MLGSLEAVQSHGLPPVGRGGQGGASLRPRGPELASGNWSSWW